MKTKRWTLGVVLAAAVSLWGLIQADASPFSSYVLTDDLDNSVHGSAPDADSWGDESGGADEGSNSGDSGSAQGGDGNNGHGNNADGVDSSNPGKGKGGPNGAVDESCDGTGECVDDEVKGGSSTSDSGSTSGSTSDSSGNGKGKKK
jgi:hypothetical protein